MKIYKHQKRGSAIVCAKLQKVRTETTFATEFKRKQFEAQRAYIISLYPRIISRLRFMFTNKPYAAIQAVSISQKIIAKHQFELKITARRGDGTLSHLIIVAKRNCWLVASVSAIECFVCKYLLSLSKYSWRSIHENRARKISMSAY